MLMCLFCKKLAAVLGSNTKIGTMLAPVRLCV